MRYQIAWDNGNASGVFPGVFTARREAEREARAWKREMVQLDHDPRAAREAYQWEIVEVMP